MESNLETKINRVQGNVTYAMERIAARGVDVPATANSDDLGNLIDEIPTGSDTAVLYTPQTLSEDEQAQARDNIGAANADFFVRTANIFDKSNPDVVMVGYFYRNSSAAYVENSNYTALTIPTKPNTTYICTGTSYTVSFLTEEKKYWNNDHSSADGSANHVFTTPENTAYTVLSVKHGKYPLDKYMVVEGDELPSSYIPYGDALSENVYVDTGENVFYVGATRRFSRFYDCINAIKDIEGEKTVYVDSGVYDLYDEIGGDEFAATITSTAWRDWSVILPNDIRIIGIGNVVFNFILPDSVSDKAYSVLSPINVYGSVYMENITINAKNCRYTLHDDGASEDMPYTRHIYKNMTFNKLSGNGYGAACGNGIGKGVTFEFDNCIINSEKTLGMSFHNQTTKADGTIIISNCYLNGTNTALRLGSMSSYGEENAIAVNVFNTKFGNKIEICMEDTATGKTNPFKATFVNCGELTFDTSEYTDMQFPPVEINGGTGGGSVDAVLYTPQTLSEDEQAQARDNIGTIGRFLKSASGEVIALTDAVESPVRGMTIYGKSVQDGTPTADNPVDIVSIGDDGSMDVYVMGGNLCSNDWEQGGINTTGGEEVSTKEVRSDYIALPAGVPLYCSRTVTTGYVKVRGYDKNKNFVGSGQSILADAQGTAIDHLFVNDAESSVCMIHNKSVCYIRVVDTSNSLDTVYTISVTDADDLQYAEPQVMPVSTPDGLCGIPVADGGNHTDISGQQWICDEVDFIRGVRVQRIGKVVLTGTENWTANTRGDGKVRFYFSSMNVPQSINSSIGLFTHGEVKTTMNSSNDSAQVSNRSPHVYLKNYQTLEALTAFLAAQYAAGTPLTIYYLVNATEIALSDEDLARYRNLHTNDTNNTIYTEVTAYMTVRYAVTSIADVLGYTPADAEDIERLSGGVVHYVTPQMYGARGNGVTDDTEAVQAAVDNSENVFFPAGTYLVSADIVIPSNRNIWGQSQLSIIKRADNDLEQYNILLLNKSENVRISDIAVVGDKHTHLGTGGEWGHCIMMQGCQNIVIKNSVLKQAWGDGIGMTTYDGDTMEGVECQNILIDGCVFDDNRRLGVAVIDCSGLTIRECVIKNTRGTNPQCGIDFEPNDDSRQRCHNCIVESCYFEANSGGDIHLANLKKYHGVEIFNCVFKSNIGLSLWGSLSDTDLGSYVSVHSCVFENLNGYPCVNIQKKSPKECMVSIYNSSLSSSNSCVAIGLDDYINDNAVYGGLRMVDCCFAANSKDHSFVEIINKGLNSTYDDIYIDATALCTAKSDICTEVAVQSSMYVNIQNNTKTINAETTIDEYAVITSADVDTSGNNITVTLADTIPYDVPIKLQKISAANSLIVRTSTHPFPQYGNVTQISLTGLYDYVVVTHLSTGEWVAELHTKDGDGYTLTDTDKTDIAGLVIDLLPIWEGGSY